MLYGRFLGALILLLLVSSPGSGFTQDTSSPGASYASPDFKNKHIDSTWFSNEDGKVAKAMAKALAKFAINLPASSGDQAKAVALAWAGARGTDTAMDVIKADFYLRMGSYPKDDPMFESAPSRDILEATASDIIRSLKLLAASDLKGSQIYASFCKDLMANTKVLPSDLMDFDGVSFVQVSWDDVMPGVGGASGNSDKKDGMVTASSSVDSSKFAKRQSLIKGLLVADLGASEVAGQASQMNATVQDGPDADAPSQFRFNQEVGSSMASALNEVQKYMTVRHGGFPKGKIIEIAFEEQFSSKDGPSAAVACSLMLDSLITGADLDPNFAVTGDMNADGSVQPVGGIAGKVSGASNRSCTHIAIPRKNAQGLDDWLVLGDLLPLVGIQVFSIGTFDEAAALALPVALRDEKLQSAITTFAEVQKVLRRPDGMRLLTNSHVRGRLQEVLTAAPNHESARLLLLSGSGNGPKTLSLRGSFDQIDRVTRPIMRIFETGEINNTAEALSKSMFALRRSRAKLDPRAREAADALEDLSAILKTLDESKVDSNSPRFRQLFSEMESSIDAVRTAYNALASDPDVQEELIK